MRQKEKKHKRLIYGKVDDRIKFALIIFAEISRANYFETKNASIYTQIEIRTGPNLGASSILSIRWFISFLINELINIPR